MYIDRMIFPVTSLGPGERLVIWTSGCSKHCRDCANPELWLQYEYQRICVDDLICHIKKYSDKIDGVTITGGDPCEQFSELLLLVSQLKDLVSDIIVYTGYTFEELAALVTDNDMAVFKNNISVLIDGRYIPEQNNGDLAMRGSANQNIIFCNADSEFINNFNTYLSQGRFIQNIVYNNRIVSVGIHNKI